MVRNPPANAGDIGWIPGLGRSHMSRVPHLLKTCLPTAHGLQQEKLPQREARVPEHAPQLRKVRTQQQRLKTAIKKQKTKKQNQQRVGFQRDSKQTLHSHFLPYQFLVCTSGFKVVGRGC